MREVWIYVSNSYVLLRLIIIFESKIFFIEEMCFVWVSNLVDYYVVVILLCYVEFFDCLSFVFVGDGYIYMVVKDLNCFFGCLFWSLLEIL